MRVNLLFQLKGALIAPNESSMKAFHSAHGIHDGRLTAPHQWVAATSPCYTSLLLPLAPISGIGSANN
jgi:hypothetical protein